MSNPHHSPQQEGGDHLAPANLMSRFEEVRTPQFQQVGPGVASAQTTPQADPVCQAISLLGQQLMLQNQQLAAQLSHIATALATRLPLPAPATSQSALQAPPPLVTPLSNSPHSAALPPQLPASASGQVRSQSELQSSEEARLILSKHGQEAFSLEVIYEPIPPNFLCPKLDLYYGDTDPRDHICSFQDALVVHSVSDAMRCKLFLTTLKEEARQWFGSLPNGAVQSFNQFISAFLSHFSASKKPRRTSDVLLAVKQMEDESLREYILRFRQTLRTVTQLNPSVAMLALKVGLKDSNFKEALSLNPPGSLEDIFELAWRYINADDERSASKSFALEPLVSSPSKSRSSPSQPSLRSDERGSANLPNRQSSRFLKQHFHSSGFRRDESRFAPARHHPADDIDLGLSVPLQTVVAAIQHKDFFQKPLPLRTDPARRSKSKFCDYHQDHGHDTEDCRALKFFLAQLIKQGHLKEFMAGLKDKSPKERMDKGKQPSASTDQQFQPPLQITEDIF